MNKRFFIFFTVFSLAMVIRPVFAVAALNSEIQNEVNQLQSDMIELSKGRFDLEEQEKKKAEIQINQKEAIPQAQGPSFQVNEITLEGNTVFPTQVLLFYAKPYEGRVLHLKDLQDLALLITTYYEKAGYMTSRAYVPPQKIQDGKVVIRIVEGHVGNVVIKGNRWFPGNLYSDRINLVQGDIFNMQQLAMDLLDINQLPDRSVKAYLQPGQEPGTSDVVIVAQDNCPLHASYEYNDQGTQLTHFSRNILHLTDNNITGHGDTLQSSFSFADQNSLSGGMLQYVLPQPKQGLTYSMNGGYYYSRLEKELRPLKVTADSYFVSGGVTKNFIREPGIKLDGYAGFEFKDSKTLVDRSKLSYDRSRVLDIGPRAVIDDKYGKTFLSGDMHGGIPGILDGAKLHDPEASRIKSGGEFVYWTGNVDRINRLPYGSFLVLHTGVQYSPMALTSLEQFYLGGMSSVRGYPENDASGDSGINFSAELRIPPYFIPSQWHLWNSKDKTWRDTLAFVAFLDGGRTFNYYRQSSGSALDSTLLSAGFGLRYYLSPDMNVQTGIGFPFGDAPTSGNKHDQMYLSARVGF